MARYGDYAAREAQAAKLLAGSRHKKRKAKKVEKVTYPKGKHPNSLRALERNRLRQQVKAARQDDRRAEQGKLPRQKAKRRSWVLELMESLPAELAYARLSVVTEAVENAAKRGVSPVLLRRSALRNY